MKHAFLVMTTINPPQQISRTLEAVEGEWQVIIAGDKKSPAGCDWGSATFLSADEQLRLESSLATAAPFNHYARKNIAYLTAMRRGAVVIAETDDDNFPYPGYLKEIGQTVGGLGVSGGGWENVYRHFCDERIWPRGFPLELITRSFLEDSVLESLQGVVCPVQQYLADDNPDVDAVYRLTTDTVIKFRANTIILHNRYCPFNSQNTLWWPAAFPYLYLPHTVSFRMTDIWRSFVAQRCLYAQGFSVAFRDATMFQERNQHSLLKDFSDEIPGYLHNAAIVRTLAALPLSSSPADSYENLLSCYEALVRGGFVAAEELTYVKHWIADATA